MSQKRVHNNPLPLGPEKEYDMVCVSSGKIHKIELEFSFISILYYGIESQISDHFCHASFVCGKI